MRKLWTICILTAGALLAPVFCRAAQVVSPFDEKIRYEKALEAKADEILLKVLGPNQARVSVEATLKIEEALGGEKEAKDPQSQFAWINAAQKRDKMKELLPGFTAPVPVTPMGADEAKAYSYKVSKLAVNIIAGGELTPVQITSVTDLVERVLALDTARGDSVELVRTQFAPAWKTIWYSPEYLGYLVRYGIVGLIIIISFLIIAFGLTQVAGAMGQVARGQDQDVSIDFKGDDGGAGRGLEGPGAAGAGLPGGKEAPQVAAPEESSRLTFNVKQEQVPLLAFMLAKEDPENIALVVYHLPEDIRGDLLFRLGKDLASKVILNLASVRFVEREMIEEIKQELEKRLESAIGGIDKALEMIAPMRYGDRKALIKSFETQNPELAAEIRSSMIFDEDLLALDEKGMGLVVSAVAVAEWGEVFPGLPEKLRARIKAMLPERSVQIIEQSMKYSSSSPEKQEEALGKFMEKVAGLVKSGKLPRPAPAGKMIEHAGAGGAAKA